MSTGSLSFTPKQTESELTIPFHPEPRYREEVQHIQSCHCGFWQVGLSSFWNVATY